MSESPSLNRRAAILGMAGFSLASCTSARKEKTPPAEPGTVEPPTVPPHAVGDGRVAIIDTAERTTEYLGRLKAAGIEVVGRYYSRAHAWKRLIDDNPKGRREVDGLLDAKFSILSVYQYNSSSANKFVHGIGTGSPRAEARADAKAALRQADMVDQPAGTAIYFGVDFDLKPEMTAHRDGVIAYFEQLYDELKGKYRLGVYSNGFTNWFLRDKNLVMYSWISASRSFAGSTEFFSCGDWHLYQNQIDRFWYAQPGQCRSGLSLDTNIQNPAYRDIGTWGNGRLSHERNRTIFGQRRIALRNAPLFKEPNVNSTQLVQSICHYDKPQKVWRWRRENGVPRLKNVRVVAENGDWLTVDVDDDGEADGYCLKQHFSGDFRRMPLYRTRAPGLPKALCLAPGRTG